MGAENIFANLSMNEDLKDKKTRKTRSRYFYQVENHQELFKIGASFQGDFASGIKSFAIGSTGYHTSQQKTIMGLASFFDHQEDLKIAIITENINRGYFSEILSEDEKHSVHLNDELCFDVVTFHNHFDFISLDELLINEKQVENCSDSLELIDNFIDSYDLIFWDVPEVHKIQNCPQIYFPILERFESLSLIVAQSLTKKEEVDHIVSFFSDYGVTLKGLLMDGREVENQMKSEKKGFWRALFR